MSEFRRDESDGVLTLTFTRPEKANALTGEMWAAVHDAVRDVEENVELRVLLVAAEGRHFTAGLDIMRAFEASDFVRPPQNFRMRYRTMFHDLLDRIESCEKLSVLAIQGSCVGLGVGMACSFDFRLASESATFQLPEIAQLSTIPGTGGISRLARLVGPHWARWLVVAGERVTAREALNMGLVHAVYPDDEFAERAAAFSRRLAGLTLSAVGMAKLAIDAAVDSDRKTARIVDAMAAAVSATSPELAAKLDGLQSRTRPES